MIFETSYVLTFLITMFALAVFFLVVGQYMRTRLFVFASAIMFLLLGIFMISEPGLQENGFSVYRMSEEFVRMFSLVPLGLGLYLSIMTGYAALGTE